MDAAWELGLRRFDTADAYGGGRSEQWIGDWLRATRQPAARHLEDVQRRWRTAPTTASPASGCCARSRPASSGSASTGSIST